MRALYEILVNRLSEYKIPVTIIVIGRSALPFYDLPDEYTYDLDFEFSTNDERLSARLFDIIKKVLSEIGIPANFGSSIDRWSVIPMPVGYRNRIKTTIERDKVRLCVLDPADYVISKLRRGTSSDQADANKVMEKFGVTKNDLENRFKMIEPVRDTEMFLFIQRFKSFVESVYPAVPET
ncbi:MAG: hypothetical protein M0031_14025 [Thermaerobacter sp.]|jgi:hypothetical protein|nr:hypothetical protein [Thermaerobacter sp.]